MIAKKNSRTAWRIAVILAVVLLGGIVEMLAHGVFIGNIEMHLRLLVAKPFGPEGMKEGPHGGEGHWAITRTHDLGPFTLEIVRHYYQELPPQN